MEGASSTDVRWGRSAPPDRCGDLSPAPHLPGWTVVHTRSRRQAAGGDYARSGAGGDKRGCGKIAEIVISVGTATELFLIASTRGDFSSTPTVTASGTAPPSGLPTISPSRREISCLDAERSEPKDPCLTISNRHRITGRTRYLLLRLARQDADAGSDDGQARTGVSVQSASSRNGCRA